MSMKCPSEQIAIELNLQPAACFKSSYFELPGSRALELIIYYQIRSGSSSSPWQMERKKTQRGGRPRERGEMSILHPPPGQIRTHRAGPRFLHAGSGWVPNGIWGDALWHEVPKPFPPSLSLSAPSAPALEPHPAARSEREQLLCMDFQC